MIEASGLTRYYGNFAAVREATFTIDDREIVGFLGLNGAGKSTMLKILAGVLLPSAGSVKVGGLDASNDPDALRRKIGFLPEEPPLYREMRVREFLQWCGEVKGRSKLQVREAMPQVLETCDLTPVADRVIGELSHGYKKRVGIAQAIIHRPEVVILDEPISGLDPQQIVEMRSVVRSLQEHSTVLISSHILSEIEQTCDRILVIHRGRIVAEGTEQELGASTDRERHLALVVRGEQQPLQELLAASDRVENFEVAEGDDEGTVAAKVELVGDDREALVAELVGAGFGLRQLTQARSELERVFLQLTAGDDAPAQSPEAKA